MQVIQIVSEEQWATPTQRTRWVDALTRTARLSGASGPIRIIEPNETLLGDLGTAPLVAEWD